MNMISKTFIIILVTINVYLCVPASQFDWNRRIETIIKEIGEKTDAYDASPNPKNDTELATYDFVFIGSGSGGSTCVAGILDAQPNARIIILEAGSHDLDPSLYNFTNGAYWAGSQYDWNDYTEYESGLGREINVPNGFSLGGSSAINYMFWIRGDPKDYDSWAQKSGDNSWNYTNVLKHFKQIENYREPDRPKLRGKSGDVFVTKEFTETPYSLTYQSLISEGLNYTNNQDYNGRTPKGVALGQFNAKPLGNRRGIRQDAFTTQLEKHLSKPNLHVLTSAYGDKVVLSDDDKVVRYLVFQRNGRSYKVRALKDVVVSAGSTRSPLVLMRSGIGACASLEAKGIQCNVNLPGVGQNLDHHPTTYIRWPIKSGVAPENLVINVVTGKIDVGGVELSKHQFISYYITQRPIIAPNLFSMGYFQAHLKSRGEIELRSTDCTDSPIIRLNTFQNEQDMADHVEGLEILLKIGETLRDRYLDENVIPLPGADLAQHARSTCVIFHPSGTCKMGRLDDPMAVVDSKLRVIGVKGLRVVDASIMPHVTSFNTNCPTMMIGAKAADEILKEYYP